MKQDLPLVTVLATFNDRVSAEIACALLSEASIHSGEPDPAQDGTWLASVRGVHPDLAGRAEVILKSARAREITIASHEQQTDHGCKHATPVHLRDQDNVPPAVIQAAAGHSLPAQRQTAFPSYSSEHNAPAIKENLLSLSPAGPLPALRELSRETPGAGASPSSGRSVVPVSADPD